MPGTMQPALPWLAAAVGVLLAMSAALAHQLQTHPTLRTAADRALLRAQVALNHPSAATYDAARTRAQRDDWITFAHDQSRTGFQAQDTGITRDTVAHLALRWTRPLGKKTVASPIVARGISRRRTAG